MNILFRYLNISKKVISEGVSIRTKHDFSSKINPKTEKNLCEIWYNLCKEKKEGHSVQIANFLFFSILFLLEHRKVHIFLSGNLVCRFQN